MANPIIHWELMVSDVARAKAFYARVFDWKFEAMGAEYTIVQTGKQPGGGLMQRPPGVPAAALNTYFQVGDVSHTLVVASENGAKVIVPRTEIPDVGWYAMFLDPDGIPIGILQPLS